MENTDYINHQIIANFLQAEDSLTTLWRAEILERPLDLSFKDVSDIPESIVHKLKHFSTVVLSNTRISIFPKALLDFTHIITLDMSRCNMKELSPAIGNLVSLKYLILDHNQLTFLPETIGKLTNLLELNVAYNNLRELPGTYGFLLSLKYLNISHNELPALPTEIGKLQNLETIIATHNQIREVNPSIGSMSKLWSINLRYNPLERVPSTLIKIIPRLTMMDFDNTPLYDHVFNSEENKNKFASVAEYLFSLPADIIVSISTFTRDMRNILNSSTFSDMKFKHGDKIYNGHRCIVSARLHRVRSDLLWNEANIIDAMKTKDCIITIKDSVPVNIFEAVLAYLYVADVTDFEAIKGYVTDTPRGSEAEQMLAKDLAALRKSGDFSDVSFTVESEEVKGHKCILAATCKTLSTFFTGEWKEARESTANLGGFSREAVELFFEYLYTGDCEVTGENVMEMLAIADVFHVDRLKEQCERLLVDGLDEDNLMLIYEAAERHSAHQLVENCAYYASRNCPPETFRSLPEKLFKIAEGLKERTKELKNQVAVISSKGSIVHKTEEERIKVAHFHWSDETELKSSAEWGKLKGYNIKDPSEVLPSGKEETEKFLEEVMVKLQEPTTQRSKRVIFDEEIDRARSSDDEAPFEYTSGNELTGNARAFMGRTGPFVGLETLPNMNVLTRGGDVIPDQVVTPIAPSISLNDNPFQAKFGQDNDEGKGLSKSPQKSPRGFNFGGGITFNAYNGETQPSTSPSTSPGGFNFSFDNASPSKTGSTTNPSKSLFTDGLAFGITKPPETISFTNDTAESDNGKQNTNPFSPVFVGGETFNFDASNNSHTSTSPVTSSNGFGFTFGGRTLSQNEANTDSSNINTFGFSFSTSPSQHGLSANTARTRSPHKSGRKSPKRDLESNEGIFGDNEKEKSMEHLITRLNFND